MEIAKTKTVLDMQVCLATNNECSSVNKMIHEKMIEENYISNDIKVIKKDGNEEIEFCIGEKIINTKNIYKNLLLYKLYQNIKLTILEF